MKRLTSLSKRLLPAVLCALLFPALAWSQKNTKLSDAEIASVAVVANQIDIDAAKLAQQKSKDPAIRDFASTMISDHTSVIDKASALVKKLGVTPQDNGVSRQLRSNAQKTLQGLKAKSGAAFNKAYVDNEVAYHEAVISTVEGKLIPEATNAELKDLLQSVLPVLRTHLEHAKMVQKNLASK
jgi:putative membrane protein